MVGPLTEGLERPGVKVFQEFGPQSPTVIRPVLQTIVAGENYQIVTKGEAGAYIGALKTFNYPDLIAGSTVLTSEVEVFLATTEGEYDITTQCTIDGTDVDVPVSGSLTLERDVTQNRKISLVADDTYVTGGSEELFIDVNADFISDQVRVGDVLRFEAVALDLELDDTEAVTLNTSDYTVLEIRSRSTLVISSALVDEDRLEYNIIRAGTASGTVSISYRARRKDLVGQLFEARDLDEVVATLGEAVPENPLAYGMALALANTQQLVGAVQVELDATAEWQEAFDFLETVTSAYAIAPLTTNPSVHQIAAQHATQMSVPKLKSERVVFIAPTNPTEIIYQTALVDGDIDSASPTTSTFDSATAQFLSNEVPVGSKIIISAGGPPLVGAVATTEFQILSVNSETQVTVLGSVDANVTGLTYTVESGELSKLQQARNAADTGASYANRRVFYVFPENVQAVVSQTEVEVASYFASAAIAGLVSGTNPSQGFSNLPIAGFTGVKGSNNFFTRDQQDIIAGGGVWILEQLSLDGPIRTRHQLSTDITSIEKRELSITKAVDFAAKFFRQQLKDLVGINVINSNFLNNVLRPATQGVVRDLVEDRVMGENTRIQEIRQSEDQPDTVEIDVRLDILYPVNYIDVTLII